MKKLSLAIVLCMVLVACEREAAAPPPAERMVAAVAPAPEVSGKEAYDQACAGCHQEGLNGAPRTDHPEDWAGRSHLWQAVLFEHAKKGYMEMPAKGGDASLNDALVDAAAEYMLERTHPGLPAD